MTMIFHSEEEFMKALTRIPELHLNANAIAIKAQNQGLWCMRGEPAIFEYVADSDNIMIMSNHGGYLVIPHESIRQVLEELGYIEESLSDIKRKVAEI